MENTEDKFVQGLNAMNRHCQTAISCIRQGKWTLDDMDKWLAACLVNDSEYLTETLKKIK